MSTPSPRPLRKLAPEFLRSPTAWIIAPSAAAMTVLRLRKGRLHAADAVVVAGMVGGRSAIEWVLHRWVLHLPPITIGGTPREMHPARAHQRHHDCPDDPTTVPIGPIGTAVLVAGISVGALPGLPRHDLRLTAATTGFGLVLAYEWTHFLLHAPYQPRSAWFTSVRRHHRRHHHADATTWFGITGHSFDRLVGTTSRTPNTGDHPRSTP